MDLEFGSFMANFWLFYYGVYDMTSVADCSVTCAFFSWPMHGPRHSGIRDINKSYCLAAQAFGMTQVLKILIKPL